jgi:hypothetical protein
MMRIRCETALLHRRISDPAVVTSFPSLQLQIARDSDLSVDQIGVRDIHNLPCYTVNVARLEV